MSGQVARPRTDGRRPAGGEQPRASTGGAAPLANAAAAPEPSPARPAREWTLEESSAYHEAGHAVVALALGIPVEWVSVERTGTAAPTGGQVDAHRRAVVALSGLIAQDVFRRAADPTEGIRARCEALRSHPPPDDDWWRDDAGAALLLLAVARAGRADPRPRAEAAIIEAAALVRRHWPAVQRLAAVLWDRGLLPGAAAAEIAALGRAGAARVDVPAGSRRPGAPERHRRWSGPLSRGSLADMPAPPCGIFLDARPGSRP
jgi:hypothetical protein